MQLQTEHRPMLCPAVSLVWGSPVQCSWVGSPSLPDTEIRVSVQCRAEEQRGGPEFKESLDNTFRYRVWFWVVLLGTWS